jgi:uncharacterized membrane protein
MPQNHDRKPIYPFVVMLASALYTIWVYPKLPDQIPTHWGISDKIDEYGSKWPNALMGPFLTVILYAAFKLLPYLDPKRSNYKRFGRAYNILRDTLVTFAAGMGVLMNSAALGHVKNTSTFIFPGLGLLYIVMGNYMGQLKQNWYAGIKTPWTLSNETVWNKTHRLGGKLMVIAGIVSLFCIFLPQPINFIVFSLVSLIWSLGSAIYSYLIFREETGGRPKP